MTEPTFRILSIDDSRAVHAFLDQCLEGSPFRIVHALTAAEAIRLLCSRPEAFALILLDWEMPDINGPETLDHLSRNGMKMPVIMLTSKSDPSEISTMLSKGAIDYIMKPFTKDILLGKLESFLVREQA